VENITKYSPPKFGYNHRKGTNSMYGQGSGNPGGPVVLGAGAATLPVTGGNPVLMVLTAAVVAVIATVVLSTIARVASKKAYKA
jgi:hypothetical protein